mmetsp:Transcript_24106/g.70999  ORF Transcript_24106/g.70999 Transcript_24106/m.70999 type:complete len:206 (+) Transcript_24106:552-1169(+)
MSTLRLGPMELHTYMLRKYLPLAPEGLFFSTVSCTALRLVSRSASSKVHFPKGTCTMPCLSQRNSNLPDLKSATAAATSVATVPALGDGMSPLGPSTRPSLAILGMAGGVAISTSKSRTPELMVCTRSSMPTMSAPAAVAASAMGPSASTATRTSLPVPLGSATVVRSCWSLYLGSSARRMCASAVSANLALDTSFITLMASAGS